MKKIIFIFLFGLLKITAFSQEEEAKIVHVTGIVVTGDSMFGVPSAHIYNSKTGLGTTSNQLGYFAMAAKVGDSITVRSLGYNKETFTVPDDTTNIVSLVIELTSDTLVLPLVTIRKFPSEQVFKRAFLSLNVPDGQYQNMDNNLNSQILRTMLATEDLSPGLTHQYFMNQQAQHYQNSITATTIPLVDPFAWSRFFKDLKREKEKKKQREREKNNRLGY